MVFFQYWVTFFSTIFIIYFYLNIFYVYGTSNFLIFQYLNSIEIKNTLVENVFIRIIVCVFLFSIFFKLGVTPLHLYKIEIYKGIPFLSIFFYTTYYFAIFVIFFLFFLVDFIGGFIPQYYLILVILLLSGSIYTILLLFDVNFIKAFFTYSTIINTIAFLMIFVSNL